MSTPTSRSPLPSAQRLQEYLQQRLTRAETAKILGVKENTLAKAHCNKTIDLPYYKLGGRAYYRRDDVLAYIERQMGAGREVA